MNKIFRLGHLLDVNGNITVKSEQNMDSGMILLTVDNILKNYQEAYDTISSSPVSDWKNAENGKNFIDYKEGRLQYPVRNQVKLLDVSYEIIKHYYNVETDLNFGSIDVNVFQQILPRTNDFNIVHTDQHPGSRSFTCLLFLNQPEECSGGTAFLQHRPSGLYCGDTRSMSNLIEDNPNLYHNGINYWNQDDGKIWQMTQYAEMKSNRLIIFPSDFFHTAYHPMDSFFDFSRLTLVFWMREV
jgi:hypothetical protein